jgi:hypothetical protein
MLSSLSVGPGGCSDPTLQLALHEIALAGYCDLRIRPWNHHNTKDRRDGDYYRQSWTAAVSLNPSFISITSWNEWHEGTQIEDCMYAAIKQLNICAFLPKFHERSALSSGRHRLQMRNLNGRILQSIIHSSATNVDDSCARAADSLQRLRSGRAFHVPTADSSICERGHSKTEGMRIQPRFLNQMRVDRLGVSIVVRRRQHMTNVNQSLSIT